MVDYLCVGILSRAKVNIIRPKKLNVEFPLTLPKKIRVGRSVIFFFFMCYFMRTLVEMLIFILFHKFSSKLFNEKHFCSPHSVVLQFYIVLLALYKQICQ